MSFTMDISEVTGKLKEIELKNRAAIGLYADTAGKVLVAHAKTNAKWTDRTAIARQTITQGYGWVGSTCYFYISGNTDYFPFLELAHEKKYAVLYPTIRALYPEVLAGMRELWR